MPKFITCSTSDFPGAAPVLESVPTQSAPPRALSACSSGPCSLKRAAAAMQAWDCVVDEAVFVAMHLVEAMLHGTPVHVKQRLAELGADIAIIGRNQVL